MPYLYILKNERGRYYIGITELEPMERLKRHNKGDVVSTRIGAPWTVVYTENFIILENARKREKQIKSWKGGNAFKKLLSKAAGSSNGRTHASEACYLGSNPSPAALERSRHKFGGVK